MSRQSPPSAAWLERARTDPSSVFASPDEVTDHQELTFEQKLEILRSWEYDAAEVAVAEEEGMRGPEDDLLRRIILAIGRLTPAEEVDAVAPTKQHGMS